MENAILDAAWLELIENGYPNLTMESVANRAQTSRPVLSRRWPDRAKLALASIRRFLALQQVQVADVGSVRDELISLLTQYISRGMPIVMLSALHMSEFYSETQSEPYDLRQSILEGDEELLLTILRRGIVRGEIDEKKLTPRLITLVPNLTRHELMMTLKPVPDTVIAEIIDEIFLPLVRP